MLTTREKSLRKKVEVVLHHTNNIHGKGQIRAVVFREGSESGAESAINGQSGLVVRQFQYGMDAVQFQVSADGRTVRFLQKQRVVV